MEHSSTQFTGVPEHLPAVQGRQQGTISGVCEGSSVPSGAVSDCWTKQKTSELRRILTSLFHFLFESLHFTWHVGHSHLHSEDLREQERDLLL